MICNSHLHCNDDIANFAACFDIAMGFGRLFQRIAAIDDWFDHACFNEIFQENQVFGILFKCSEFEILTASL